MGGFLWLLVNPVCQILVYGFVFNVVLKLKLGGLGIGTDSFFLFFLTGMFPWLAFSEGVVRCSGILHENSNLVTKVRFPVELLPTTGVLASFFINGIGFALFLLYLLAKGMLSLDIFLVPVVFAGFFLFSMGVSMLVAAISVFLRDVQQALPIVLFVWFYTTPILYPKEMVPEVFRFAFYLNPVFPFTELFHGLILGTGPSLQWIVLSGLWLFFSWCLGLSIFFKLRPSFGDVL